MAKLLETFARRGIVEGFFGPLWSMPERMRLFEFGAARDMNTYLYAPKDDPYHRKLWRLPYPRKRWQEMLRLIAAAQRRKIDFVYGFHPGAGLRFGAEEPIRILHKKARRFYDAGVRTFAVLFDDIPSRLSHAADRKCFKNSLAAAQGNWMARLIDAQPPGWNDVEWWVCPSYYTPDPWLARVFGAFEKHYLERFGTHLPAGVACFWTGPSVVSRKISLGHVRGVLRRIGHPLILWDNYPVNDLSMSDELHIGPLQGRDPRLPQSVYGYLNNPLLQPELGFVPLATCFDYARNPRAYRPESSWSKAVRQRFGPRALAHWRAIRRFCENLQLAKSRARPLRLAAAERRDLHAAERYLAAHRRKLWAMQIAPWRKMLRSALR